MRNRNKWIGAGMSLMIMASTTGCSLNPLEYIFSSTEAEQKALEVTEASIIAEETESALAESTEVDEKYDGCLTKEDAFYRYLVAYETGDNSKLSTEEIATLSVAMAIVSAGSVLDTDYEKILYVHDYLTANTQYAYSDNQFSEYGALVEHEAVCQGYAYAFKLCMDLMHIPCITVGGTAEDYAGDSVTHAWNLVYCDENWYHVDVTWDDPTSDTDHGNWSHTFFMVSDAYMTEDHQWDTVVQGMHSVEGIPLCLANDKEYYGYYTHNEVTSQSEFEVLFNSLFSQELKNFEIKCRGFVPDYTFITSITNCSLVVQERKDAIIAGFFI